MDDGVYTDATKRRDEISIGLVVIINGYADAYYYPTPEIKGTNKAEEYAIAVAKRVWPDLPVYCDHADIARKFGAKYINRNMNELAHKAARNEL